MPRDPSTDHCQTLRTHGSRGYYERTDKHQPAPLQGVILPCSLGKTSCTVSQRMHLYEISIGADLPSAGIHKDDQYGPGAVDDTGDVVAVRSSEETWLIRLQPGIHQMVDIYS